METTGRWVQEGLNKLRGAIQNGEKVSITDFVLSGSATLGSLVDFTVDDAVTAVTFPRVVYSGQVDYALINESGFLEIHAEVAADVEEEFCCNGIGLIFKDLMGMRHLMAMGRLPVQQHARMVNNRFEFTLPIVSDVAGVIEVSLEPLDRVSQSQMAGAIQAHSQSVDAHADYRNAVGAVVMYLLDMAGLAHREHQRTLTQRFQNGLVEVRNRGVISGCEVTKSTDATRNLSMAGGKVFMNGVIVPANEQLNGAIVPVNDGTLTTRHDVYLNESLDLVCVPEGTAVNGILLYKVEVPPGNTETTDPHLGNVTLIDIRRMEPFYPTMVTSSPSNFISLNYKLDGEDYALDFSIESYSGNSFGVGELHVSNRSKNGFMILFTGTVDEVRIRWTACKLNS